MSKSMELRKDTLTFAATADREGCPIQKGQIVIYEGEEAEIISIKPLLIIKTKHRVVCGALQNLAISRGPSRKEIHKIKG